MSQLFASGGQSIGVSASASVTNEYSGLISFRIDWLDLLAVQGTLKSLFQHHSSKASILQHSAFFIVQFSHLYITTGKTIAVTIRTFVSKVMSLLFHMLSRFAIAFLPRRKHLLISWLQSPSAVILESKKRKSVTAFTFSPSISSPDHQGVQRCHIFYLKYGTGSTTYMMSSGLSTCPPSASHHLTAHIRSSSWVTCLSSCFSSISSLSRECLFTLEY